MNGFSKKKVGTLTLGEKLKKLRNDRRASLLEVSRATRIQVKYLEYIESGNFDQLPADVYVKGFLKGYADFLGVDEQILLKLYSKERGIQNNLDKRSGKKKPATTLGPIRISFFTLTPKRIVAFSSGVLALVIIIFLYLEVGSFANNPKLVILSPEDNFETSDSVVLLEGIAEKDAKVFVNAQPILVREEGDFKESITLQAGINSIEIRSINRFDKETKKVLSVSLNKPVEEEKIGEAVITEEKKEVDLEIKVDPGPVWLKVESDGELVFNGTMLSGVTQIFKAEREIRVSSGKANATWIKSGEEEFHRLAEEEGAIKDKVFPAN